MRTTSKEMIRCDVCGLAKGPVDRGWRSLTAVVDSTADDNDVMKRERLNLSMHDICPRCYDMMHVRVFGAVRWAMTL